jgi:hypothetical protein
MIYLKMVVNMGIPGIMYANRNPYGIVENIIPLMYE